MESKALLVEAVRKEEMGGGEEKAIDFEEMPDDDDEVDELEEFEQWKVRGSDPRDRPRDRPRGLHACPLRGRKWPLRVAVTRGRYAWPLRGRYASASSVARPSRGRRSCASFVA